MFVRIKVFSADEELLEWLEQQGVKARIRDGAIIIKPYYYAAEEDAQGREMYKLPRHFLQNLKYQVQMNAAEVGSGWSKAGSAKIICGSNGDPLRPNRLSYVGRRVSRSPDFYKIYAHFSSVDDFVEISGEWMSVDISFSIHRHHLVVEGDRAWVESQLLWSGSLTEFHMSGPRMYHRAVDALVSMSNADSNPRAYYYKD